MTLIGTKDFPREIQWTDYTCGACATFMIASFYGHDVTYRQVKKGVRTTEDGTMIDAMVRYLRSLGLRVACLERMKWRQLVQAIEEEKVVMVSLDGDHVGVVHAIDQDEDKVHLSDPSPVRQPRRTTTIGVFKRRWDREGIVVCPRRRRRIVLKKSRKTGKYGGITAMADIDIKHTHHCSRKKAKSRVAGLVRVLEKKHGFDGAWSGAVYKGTATGINKGRITVTDKAIHVEVELSWLGRPFKNRIKEEIHDALEKYC